MGITQKPTKRPNASRQTRTSRPNPRQYAQACISRAVSKAALKTTKSKRVHTIPRAVVRLASRGLVSVDPEGGSALSALGIGYFSPNHFETRCCAYRTSPERNRAQAGIKGGLQFEQIIAARQVLREAQFTITRAAENCRLVPLIRRPNLIRVFCQRLVTLLASIDRRRSISS
jgi:hypothetical protein